MYNIATVYTAWVVYGDLLSGSYVPQYTHRCFMANKFIATLIVSSGCSLISN